MKKITKATFKSFLAKNQGNLFIRKKSSFDGMVDCVMPCESQWDALSEAIYPCENNLGFSGVWLVHGSRNSFREVNADGFFGINVYNCCGEFTVAVKI